ncbi:uncharacterized protein [Hyperolius riggenbachi]|uniref:uncharacterized protein n=1 Tax=Hyperolius riggenbachi TaxID=752182 RepID=UPI0035A2AB8C
MAALHTLKEKILNFTLEGSEIGARGYDRVLFQVCGYAGNGKSSFINSLIYSLRGGRYNHRASVSSATESQGGCTMRRNSYPLTDTITLVDNRGFSKSDENEMEEVYAQLSHLQPLDENVIWETSFAERMKSVIKVKPEFKDLLIPILVHSAELKLYEDGGKRMRDFLTTAKKLTGCAPIIIITKKLSGDAETLEKQFKKLGMENIFAVENYTVEDCTKTKEKEEMFLTILSTALDQVDFMVHIWSSLPGPEEAHYNRMQLVLEIAHRNEMEKRIEGEKNKWQEDHGRKNNKKPCSLQ